MKANLGNLAATPENGSESYPGSVAGHSSSCRGCETRWTGLAACHCTGCHETFGTVRPFDMHQKRGKCHDPASVGLVIGERGYWVRQFNG